MEGDATNGQRVRNHSTAEGVGVGWDSPRSSWGKMGGEAVRSRVGLNGSRVVM